MALRHQHAQCAVTWLGLVLKWPALGQSRHMQQRVLFETLKPLSKIAILLSSSPFRRVKKEFQPEPVAVLRRVLPHEMSLAHLLRQHRPFVECSRVNYILAAGPFLAALRVRHLASLLDRFDCLQFLVKHLHVNVLDLT